MAESRAAAHSSKWSGEQSVKRYRYYSPLERALIAQLYQLKTNAIKFQHSDNPELLHALRGAVLRLAFAIKYFNKWIEANEEVQMMLQRVRRRMGSLRALDIALSRLQRDVHDLSIPPAKLRPIRGRLLRKHAKARQKVLADVTSSEYGDMISSLELLIGYQKLPHESPVLPAVLRKLQAWKRSPPAGKDLHKVRKTFKELNYHLEFWSSGHNSLAIEFQSILGARQDAETTLDLLSSSSLKDNVLRKLINNEKQCIRKYEKLFFTKWAKTPLVRLKTVDPEG